MKEPVIIVKFKDSETLKPLPNIYITSLEEAIRANAGDFEKLEEIRKRLIGLRADVDYLQSQIWAKEHGIVLKSKEMDY